MNKQEFLAKLRRGIDGLPLSDINRSLDYYSEMIDDRMENGQSEADAVASMGEVEEIVSQILSGYSSEKKESLETQAHTKEKRPIKVLVAVLAILGFPVWLPLLAAAFIILLAVYIVMYAIVAALWIVDLSFAVGGIACLPLGGAMAITGNGTAAPFAWGVGSILIGLSILLFFGALQTTVGIAKASVAIVKGIVHIFVGKGNKNEKVN